VQIPGISIRIVAVAIDVPAVGAGIKMEMGGSDGVAGVVGFLELVAAVDG
jgi:hypothetical protein